jgi:UDPglucose 6-dehydrogenase
MSVIGCGHLGATHAACMASLGHEVIGVDIDQAKVDLLNSGKGWFHEPGLDPLLAAGVEGGRLRFTTDFAEAAEFAAVHFIGVATPGHADGSYDLSQLRAAVSSLVPHLRGDGLIIGKSTVAPGTAAALQAIADDLTRPGLGRVEIAWNPEFLREGYAVADTLRPDRIVVGAASAAAADTIREIYRPQTDAGIPLLVSDLATAELAKGAANALLATKISFINAMADICAATGGDISALATSLGLDPRIGPAFLKAGLGYGGACLPKDVRGLGTFAGEVGALGAAALLGAVDAINSARIAQAVGLVKEAVHEIAGSRIAVWGAAFKAGTDDVRDSAGLLLADQLRELGASVMVYDPAGTGGALAAFPALGYADSAIAAAVGADAIVVVTAWPEFLQADAAEVARVVGTPTVIDVCQGIDMAAWQEAGWQVASLTGVPASLPRDRSTSSVALAAESEALGMLWRQAMAGSTKNIGIQAGTAFI